MTGYFLISQICDTFLPSWLPPAFSYSPLMSRPRRPYLIMCNPSVHGMRVPPDHAWLDCRMQGWAQTLVAAVHPSVGRRVVSKFHFLEQSSFLVHFEVEPYCRGTRTFITVHLNLVPFGIELAQPLKFHFFGGTLLQLELGSIWNGTRATLVLPPSSRKQEMWGKCGVFMLHPSWRGKEFRGGRHVSASGSLGVTHPDSNGTPLSSCW